MSSQAATFSPLATRRWAKPLAARLLKRVPRFEPTTSDHCHPAAVFSPFKLATGVWVEPHSPTSVCTKVRTGDLWPCFCRVHLPIAPGCCLVCNNFTQLFHYEGIRSPITLILSTVQAGANGGKWGGGGGLIA